MIIGKQTFMGNNGDCGKIIGRDRYIEIIKCLRFCSDHQIQSKSHLV